MTASSSNINQTHASHTQPPPPSNTINMTIPMVDPSLYHVAPSYRYSSVSNAPSAVSPPAACSTTPTATANTNTTLFSSHPLPIMQPSQAPSSSHEVPPSHRLQQQAMTATPLYQLMHSQSQLQHQQHQHMQLQQQQQQQQQHTYQPEASTSTNTGGGSGYIGTPLLDSSGPASPVDDSSLSARDRRASKKGTKRPRPTLSCTECVRRKSKCDRVGLIFRLKLAVLLAV